MYGNKRKVQIRGKIVKSNEIDCIVRYISSMHCVKPTSFISKLEKQDGIYLRLMKARSQKKYCCSHMVRRLISAVAAFSHQLSFQELRFIIHLIIDAHYHDAGLEINTEKFGTCYLPLTN